MTNVAALALMWGWTLPGCTCTLVRPARTGTIENPHPNPRGAAWKLAEDCQHHGGAA